jgi:CP family cyanate transporter-like MFS transporter
LWLAGADLRVTILALPPVLPLIHRDLALSEKLVGALSGLPVLLFGLAAVPGSLLIARLGARRALIVGLVMVALGSACRGIGPSVIALFAMTFVMGAGIAVMQPALPALVAAWFPSRAKFATAIYANGLLVGETAAAALTLPLVLPLLGGSWRASFVLWSAPVLIAALLFACVPQPSERLAATSPRPWWPDTRNADTWLAGLILGGGSSIYFGSNAFIPDFLSAIARPELIGPCLSSLNAGQFPASVLILLFPQRTVGRRGPIVAVALLAPASLALFLPGQDWAMVLGAAILGFASAFVLIWSLALPPLLAALDDVHRLSAGMFAIGYFTAFLLPLASGVVWDLTGMAASAFLPVVAGSALACAVSALLRSRVG